MKIYDCFMYMNEDVILELRFNHLDKHVDFFVIVESTYYHNGKKKTLNFDINKFSKFKKKIIYLVLDKEPENIELIDHLDSEEEKNRKHILNGMRRDFFQRNFIENGLKNCHEEDIILISDIDEIPKLENFNKKTIGNDVVFFKQKMFYYKFNLCSALIEWYGTRACKKSNLKNPQWLRNLKSKNYPFWRLDILFSSNKIRNAQFINDGGWHFSYLNTAEQIENKLKNYAHYWEFNLSSLKLEDIKNRIQNKKSIYDLLTDMTNSKFKSGQQLKKVSINMLPPYLIENQNRFINWLDT
jgi:beta-1,4-mannosyl-glycoprotein beta-1,4-N-acetylglucosaminyltransferase